jgi:hypothetical protein
MGVDPLAFKLVQSGVEGTNLNVRQHHSHVCSTKRTREGKSDAAGPASYERTFALKFAHVHPPRIIPTTRRPLLEK